MCYRALQLERLAVLCYTRPVRRNVAQDNRERARRKWEALGRMTVARGCTIHEAATAAQLRAQLDQRYGFSSSARTPPPDPDFDRRQAADEARAAMRWRWEYRRCGKPRCWCMKTTAPGHGPYKYGKRRTGKTVGSIYLGR